MAERRYAYKKIAWRILATVADAIGYRFVRPPTEKKLNPKKILVVRLDQLGDVVMALPVFDALHHSFPQAQIDALTSIGGSEIIKRLPYVKNILAWECPWFDARRKPTITLPELIGKINQENYDCVLELRGDIRLIRLFNKTNAKNLVGYGATGGGFLLDVDVPWDWALHAIDKNVKLVEAIGGTVVSREPKLNTSRAWSDDLFNAERRIVIHPDAGASSKKWPVNYFSQLITRLAQKETNRITLVGGATAIGDEIVKNVRFPIENKMGKTNLTELIELLGASDLLISNDSGPAHLMAALGKPVLLLWSGVADPSIWLPRGRYVSWIHHHTACAPCSLATCRFNNHPCMNEMSPDQVFQKIQGIG